MEDGKERSLYNFLQQKKGPPYVFIVKPAGSVGWNFLPWPRKSVFPCKRLTEAHISDVVLVGPATMGFLAPRVSWLA